MTDDDFEMLPFSFVKKYGTFLNSMADYQKMEGSD